MVFSGIYMIIRMIKEKNPNYHNIALLYLLMLTYELAILGLAAGLIELIK